MFGIHHFFILCHRCFSASVLWHNRKTATCSVRNCLIYCCQDVSSVFNNRPRFHTEIWKILKDSFFVFIWYIVNTDSRVSIFFFFTFFVGSVSCDFIKEKVDLGSKKGWKIGFQEEFSIIWKFVWVLFQKEAYRKKYFKKNHQKYFLSFKIKNIRSYDSFPATYSFVKRIKAIQLWMDGWIHSDTNIRETIKSIYLWNCALYICNRI